MILVKLILAHLLGDFILQPASWVKAKEEKKHRAWQLYAHTLLHGLLIMVLVWDADFIVPAIVIMISHGLIDALKLHAQKESTKRNWFIADQLLHLVVIATVWMVVERPEVTLNFSHRNVLIVTAVVFITKPASVIIKTLISQWTPASNGSTESLEDAGKYIGILERLLVFIFTITGNWEAIGFLIAAKSVFRFGDLKDSHDLKLTEYVLIGTLLSFSMAIGAGWVVNYFS